MKPEIQERSHLQKTPELERHHQKIQVQVRHHQITLAKHHLIVQVSSMKNLLLIQEVMFTTLQHQEKTVISLL